MYAEMGCDTIRYQLVNIQENVFTVRRNYRTWLERELEQLCEIAYTAGSAYNLQFIADLHTPFGGVVMQGTDNAINQTFLDEQQEQFWREDIFTVIDKTKYCTPVFAIEIMNEPYDRPMRYSKFLIRNAEWLKSITNRRLYVSPIHGDPNKLRYMPRTGLGKQFFETAHFWPPMSLIGAGGFEAKGNEQAKIEKRVGWLRPLKIVQARQREKKRILVGEVGCTRGIGDELQRMYMQRVLRYCKSLRLDVLVHGESGNPHYGYEETGVLDIVAECFREK
jgi:hypothetical protein